MSLQLKTVDGEEVVFKTIKRNKKDVEVPARMTPAQFKERVEIMKIDEKIQAEKKAYLELRSERQSIIDEENEKVRLAVAPFLRLNQADLKRALELVDQLFKG